MRCLLSLSSVFLVSAQAPDANPAPYHVINVDIENSSPGPIESRLDAETSRLDMARRVDRAAFLGDAFTDSAPIVEVSLSGAVNPHPKVGTKIAEAEAKRSAMETQKLAALTSAYSQILSQARAQIISSVHRSSRSAFLKMNPIEPSIRVKLVPAVEDSYSAVGDITTLEAKREQAELAMLNGAVSELSEFAKTVVQEMMKALSSRTSFLQHGRQMNVKLMNDENYPTITRMISQMEERRDISEQHLRAVILDLQLKLAQALNNTLRDALKA